MMISDDKESHAILFNLQNFYNMKRLYFYGFNSGCCLVTLILLWESCKKKRNKFLFLFVTPSRFELETYWLEVSCSIQLSYGAWFFSINFWLIELLIKRECKSNINFILIKGNSKKKLNKDKWESKCENYKIILKRIIVTYIESKPIIYILIWVFAFYLNFFEFDL